MRLPTQLLSRKRDANKGDFGHVLIIAGSAAFSGAAVLCAEAAIRSGAGLVTLGIPAGLNNSIIRIKPKEVMTLPLSETCEHTVSLGAYSKIREYIRKIDVLVIGPGLGLDGATQRLVRKIVSCADKPMVLDADGLNALAGHTGILRAGIKVLTPHPGEMARLLGVSVKRVQASREEIAEKFSKQYHVVLVLKGYKTIVADYKGNTYVNRTGNPGMASAGSGDVLTGVIAAFIGQGLEAFTAAKYAVYLHGLAGDLAAKEKTQLSMIASDIIDKLPKAIKKCS